MGLNCSYMSCCYEYGCAYKRPFRDCCRRRNKTAPESDDKSPPPSIALTIASKSLIDEQSIQEQISLFHFGQQGMNSSRSPSGRRYSHPNQAKWVEEYERRKSQPGSPCPSIPAMMPEEDDYNFVREPSKQPADLHDSQDVEPVSPVMQFPVIPPGRLL